MNQTDNPSTPRCPTCKRVDHDRLSELLGLEYDLATVLGWKPRWFDYKQQDESYCLPTVGTGKGDFQVLVPPDYTDGPYPGIPNYCRNLDITHAAELQFRGPLEVYHNDAHRHRRWDEYAYRLLRLYGVSATAEQRVRTMLEVAKVFGHLL